VSGKIEDFRQRVAELGKRNLYFLCKVILGFDRLTPHLHREVCSVVEDPRFSRKLILIPRGHYKSTIATKGRSIQWVLKNPNERVLIVSATATNAERFLRQIEAQYEQNALFRWVYKEHIPEFNKTTWSKGEAIVKRTEHYPEPTYDTAGVGTALPSRHYTKILKDDICNDVNTNTQELIDQVIEWDAGTVPLFDDPEDPSNEELVVGTPWSKLDVYSIKRKDPEYGVYIRHSLEDANGKPDWENGQPIFPERFSREKLVRIRKRLSNDDLFFCQYMCDPHGGINAMFRRDHLQWFEVPPTALEISITCDPGGIRDADGDFTAFTVVGVDSNNDWYVLETIKQRMNPREMISMMFTLMDRYPTTHSFGVEEVAYQKTIRFFAEEEMRRTGRFIPFVQLKTDTRIKKTMRIRALIPRFSNRSVWLRKGHSADLEDELFERVKNDDLKDALAYQLQVATIMPQIALESMMDDPLSIDNILMEVAKQHRPVGRVLQHNLNEYYRDTRDFYNQLEEK
jgi:phage terminase large subunit-like protein